MVINDAIIVLFKHASVYFRQLTYRARSQKLEAQEYPTMTIKYWLFKSEPDVFSIDHLKKSPKQTHHWDGVRNYQARNFLRDDVKTDDQVIFYHSSCEVVGAAGVCQVVREAYPDHTQFDPESEYFDSKASLENPRWVMVDVKWIESFPATLQLKDMREVEELDDMTLMKRGNRLSLFPITKKHFDKIVKLGRIT